MLAPWVVPFLQQLAIDGNVSRAARVAAVSSTQVYALRKQDADFAEAWRIALEDAGDNLVAEARRRAVDGVNEPIVYQGSFSYEYERDDEGSLVIERYDTGEIDKEGKPVMGSRPKVLIVDGRPVVATVNKKSDSLLALLLKGFKKQMFADRTELTGAEGEPVAIDESTRAARIAQIMALAQQRKDFSDLA